MYDWVLNRVPFHIFCSYKYSFQFFPKYFWALTIGGVVEITNITIVVTEYSL